VLGGDAAKTMLLVVLGVTVIVALGCFYFCIKTIAHEDDCNRPGR
jgi:hypothetical protein